MRPQFPGESSPVTAQVLKPRSLSSHPWMAAGILPATFHVLNAQGMPDRPTEPAAVVEGAGGLGRSFPGVLRLPPHPVVCVQTSRPRSP